MVTLSFTEIAVAVLAVWASGFFGILITKWVDMWKTRSITVAINELWAHARQSGDDFATVQRRSRDIEGRLSALEEKDG